MTPNELAKIELQKLFDWIKSSGLKQTHRVARKNWKHCEVFLLMSPDLELLIKSSILYWAEQQRNGVTGIGWRVQPETDWEPRGNLGGGIYKLYFRYYAIRS